MSGGSFSYLHMAFTETEAADHPCISEMAEALEEYAPTHPVTAYTRELADRESPYVHMHVADVWHAFEWWRSGDWSEQQVQEALAAYEGPGS